MSNTASLICSLGKTRSMESIPSLQDWIRYARLLSSDAVDRDETRTHAHTEREREPAARRE